MITITPDLFTSHRFQKCVFRPVDYVIPLGYNMYIKVFPAENTVIFNFLQTFSFLAIGTVELEKWQQKLKKLNCHEVNNCP